MDLEQGALTALGAVTTALVFTTRILFAQSAECRRSRDDLAHKLLELTHTAAHVSGLLEGCAKSGGCPLIAQRDRADQRTGTSP
jgi:hypothetical protein